MRSCESTAKLVSVLYNSTARTWFGPFLHGVGICGREFGEIGSDLCLQRCEVVCNSVPCLFYGYLVIAMYKTVSHTYYYLPGSMWV